MSFRSRSRYEALSNWSQQWTTNKHGGTDCTPKIFELPGIIFTLKISKFSSKFQAACWQAGTGNTWHCANGEQEWTWDFSIEANRFIFFSFSINFSSLIIFSVSVLVSVNWKDAGIHCMTIYCVRSHRVISHYHRRALETTDLRCRLGWVPVFDSIDRIIHRNVSIVFSPTLLVCYRFLLQSYR